MLLNEVERLGVLQGRALWSLESAFTKLRWSAFESDRIYEARFRSKGGLGENSGAGWQEEGSGVEDTRVFIFPREVVENIGKASSIPIFLVSMAFPPIYRTREMTNYMRESFIWHSRSALHLPRPLLEDFRVLCPRFSLFEAEGATADFELPEIVQVTFYAILLNEEVELGVAHDFTAESMKPSFIGLRWSTFEVWMDCVDLTLRGAQLHRSSDEVEVCGSRHDQEEGSGSAGPPAPSSNEE
ncbi:hypothetical protein Cgig2_021093 [Carnegiea gigantea]|uniref:Uncharacterized protein n=1 Tax=Carnegiea gigantea TaxID=171969 RepID=A0A9Q1JR41_9CARY|nr:hypothetical protein Cgig2_021093 [Carnegiea gigantea]